MARNHTFWNGGFGVRSSGAYQSQYRVSMGRGRVYQSPITSFHGASRSWKSGSESGCGRPSGIGNWWSKPSSGEVEAGRQPEDRLAVLDGDARRVVNEWPSRVRSTS